MKCWLHVAIVSESERSDERYTKPTDGDLGLYTWKSPAIIGSEVACIMPTRSSRSAPRFFSSQSDAVYSTSPA